MTTTDNSKKYSIIAAVCFVLAAIVYLFTTFDSVQGFIESHSYFAEYWPIWVIPVGFAVTLFLGNKHGTAIVSGVNALYWAWAAARSQEGFALATSLAYAAVLATIIMVLKKKQIVRKIWFVGCALQFLAIIFFTFGGFYFNLQKYSSLPEVLEGLKFNFFMSLLHIDWIIRFLLEFAGLLFMGLWLKESDYLRETKPVMESPRITPQAVGTPSPENAFNGAEKIKLYKELLDSGAITQEEFDAKKKEILGL